MLGPNLVDVRLVVRCRSALCASVLVLLYALAPRARSFEIAENNDSGPEEIEDDDYYDSADREHPDGDDDDDEAKRATQTSGSQRALVATPPLIFSVSPDQLRSRL